MAERKKLSRKQLAVLADLFGGELDEQAVLEKHRVNRNVYNRWLADGLFTDEFDRRINSARRQSAALLAKYASLAAAKLVQLTDCEKEETARKACLDIISLQTLLDKKMNQPDNDQAGSDSITGRPQQISEQTASKLLGALAQEESGE